VELMVEQDLFLLYHHAMIRASVPSYCCLVGVWLQSLLFLLSD